MLKIALRLKLALALKTAEAAGWRIAKNHFANDACIKFAPQYIGINQK